MNSRVGDLLIQTGLITQEQLEQAMEMLERKETSLTACLSELDILSEEDYTQVISEQFGVPIVELDDYSLDSSVLELIPQNLAHKYKLIPLVRSDSSLTIAMADPSNMSALNEIKFITGLDIKVVLALESAIDENFEKHYENNVSYESILEDIDDEDLTLVEEDDVDLDSLEKATEDAPVVKLVNAVLTDAIKKGASDIHIEPYEKTFRIRFRIDGVLYDIMNPPIRLKNAMTSRLKIMADLDIAERRLPQDGRIKIRIGQAQREMDFRVNVLPTLFGEKVVLRLLDKSNLQLDMTKLGFFPEQLEDFKAQISKPHGMVLVTGPTGSGKTTTLYSALSDLNKVGTNISTAEDPVEFNLEGINQAQMHDDIGFNFASALRAFLRQDPDIIMVGEIRDYETAEIGIKASLTGHLVLSTLHTNDAPATVSRLLNMGVEPFLVASSVNLIVAQRLARRICSNCVEEVKVTPDILINLGFDEAEAKHMTVKQGKGCPKCAETGYKGRVALYEVMTMKDEIKELILNGGSTADIKREAEKVGMKSLRASGLIRIKEGVTTIEEVLRVTSA